MGFFYDYTIVLLLPAIVLSLYAQMKVSSTFSKYQKVKSKQGMTGADVAKMLLASSGVQDVKVERIAGNLTDHYDPRHKVVRLSDSVYNSTSVAAVGVAAHETGHAMQDDEGYVPLRLRSSIFPVVSLGSNLAMPLIILGLLFTAGRGSFGDLMISVGIILFTFVVCFQIVTLPVEFNASSRALALLEENHILRDEENYQAKKVLSAAALTYVAAALSAVLNLIRLLMIANRRR